VLRKEKIKKHKKEIMPFVPVKYKKMVSIIFSNHERHYQAELEWAEETNFEDISNCWGKEAIEALAARKIVLGKEEVKFDPKSTMTRAEYVTVIVRYFGLT